MAGGSNWLRRGPALNAIYLVLVICLLGKTSAKPRLGQQWNDEYHNTEDEESRPFYIECLTSTECFKGHCCAIGRQQFSLPNCMLHSGPGDSCFPESVPIKRNHTYPDGARVYLKNVYDLMCPCADGLHCDPHTHTCIDNGLAHEINLIDDEKPILYKDYED